MIDTTHRFQGHNSLRFAYQKGKTVRGQFCSLKYVLNRRRETYRVAVVVSRKVHKSAVVRNRIRRRIYEVIRQEAHNITAPYDIVVLVYSDQMASMPAIQLRSAILDKLEKASIILPQGHSALASHDIVKPKES